MKITIIGLGAYAIALAKVFYENDNKVSMYSTFKDEVDIVKLKRENINVFPGVKIPKDIEITSDLDQSMQKSKIIVLAVPMNAVREVSKEISKYLIEDQVVCIVSKGIEQKTNKLMSEVVFEETGCKVELTGVLGVANKLVKDDIWISVVFATKLLDENIKFDKSEILDVKWFTYEEILNMKTELRAYDWITNSINAVVENKVTDIDLVKMIK